MGVSINTLRGWEQKKHEPSAMLQKSISEKFFKNGGGK